MIIAGDLGGTNCRLLLAEVQSGQVVVRGEQHYPARDFTEFETILERFVNEYGLYSQITSACFAVAGPVRDRRVALTNLPWTLDSERLEQRFAIRRVSLINDFVANAYSLAALNETDYHTLQTGQVSGGNRVVLGPGTGLGMALVSVNQDTLTVLPSEGGHMDFAPLDDEQADLLRFLQRSSVRVSYEQILSGPGLVRLYGYYAWRQGVEVEPVLHSDDAPATISRLAMVEEEPEAVKALNLFFRIYGSCAANLALVGLATGGVYLAGGITAHLLAALEESDFLETFNNKPPMKELLETMPIKAITTPRAGLLGAAWYAGNR
ncbi:MAG: glucokinase [Thiohalophilus sp.]|uniref:glucokinase n=1 Tax=Thiohalophilus sp. TaxID=3028392 RepID=UPI0028700B74|nr:glucokinase [Thiohalophilus sp.]MDR9435410.1 glucokinase [Thiohalophilus sp.]